MGCCLFKEQSTQSQDKEERIRLESDDKELQNMREKEDELKASNQRSDLKQKEDELQSINKRLAETQTAYENELHDMKSALRENEKLKLEIERLTAEKSIHEKEIQEIRKKEDNIKSANQRLTETNTSLGNELHQMRSNLKQKENELQSINKSLTDMEKKLIATEASLSRKQQEFTSFKDRMAGQLFVSKPAVETDDLHKQKLEETISALRNKEEELKSLNERLTKTKASHENELYHMRSELKQKEEEVKSLKQRLQESAQVRSSPQRCNTKGCEHKESMTQMEMFYKEKLIKAQSEKAKKQKELKSVKDRLAAQVAASLKTGDTESMNNPVSKTRLTEMYDNLKLLQWPNVKDQLKSRKMNPKETKDLIQKTFGNASDEMKRRRQQIEEMFQQSESSSGPTPQKVKEYRQLTVQNLQMALFHTKKEELLETGSPECLDEFPEEVKEDLRPLTSECYWLSCLMALNNPPLQPDWKNHVPRFDSWDIFPREVKPSVM